MSVKDFLNPSVEIQRSVDALSLFYQMIRQGDVALFIKKGKDKFYKGSITDYFRLQDMKEFMALDKNKPWDSLLKTVFMWRRHSTQFDVSKFAEMPMNDIYEVSRILRDGLIAYSILEKWMAPINQKASLDAIYDASKVTMNVNKWSTFEVLKVGDLKTDSSKGVGLYNHLLEIKSPEELINYFVVHEENPKDCLILTYQQGIRFKFKFTFYMFLLYKNKMYSISNRGHRLNLFNTAGARNPGKYLDRQFKDVWLPIGKILDMITESQKKEKSLMLPNTQVFKVMTIEELIEALPESKFWLEMFLFKVIDLITNTKIEDGLTTTGVNSLLALENKLDDRSIQVHASQADAGGYLAKKYDESITSIVVKEEDFPDVVGSRDYITNLIKYRRRQIYAEEVQQKAIEDYLKNYDRVFKWWKKFVESHNYITIIKRVLLDKKYTRMFYHNFSYVSWKNKEQKVGLGKESIISEISDTKSSYYSSGKVNVFNWTDTGKLHIKFKIDTNYVIQRYDYKNIKCPCCRRAKWKTVIGIMFKDYRQIVEFFGIKKEDLPKEIVEHLHQQIETYVGNSILDDTDPIDEIHDPWFQKYGVDEPRGGIRVITQHDRPHLEFFMPICNMCKYKFMRQLGIKIEKPEKKPKRIITKEDLKKEKTGWDFKDNFKWYGKRHFFVDSKSICEKADSGYSNKFDNDDDNWENCVSCRKKLKKIREEK